MRIEQVGGQLSSGNVSKPISPMKRTDSTSSEHQVKNEQKTVKQSSLKQLERHHVEAEIAAERRSSSQEHEVIKAIEKANKHIRTFDRRLEFSIHDATKQIMVKVVNTEDDSVIREIPSEKILDMVAHMWEVAGILIDEKR